MSRRAQRTENTVSLFPFLAVLICAMGALILLLLVTTRRIRHQQAHLAATAVTEPAAEDEATVPPAPQLFAPDPDDRPLEPLFAAALPAPLIDPNEEWRQRLSALLALKTELASGVESQASTVEQLRTTIDADVLIAREFENQAKAIESQKQNLLETYERLQRQESESAERAALLRRQIDETREQLADADSKFTIMPYDGRTGTTRRPIILECTATGITFVSEGITLRPSDLDGFTPRYNPLLYASRSLSKYWERKDSRSAIREYRGEPYILLVVRPQGTVAYYVARSLLGPMNDSFGYELVREDQQFMWPESDPEAVKLCRQIVDRMLAERDELIDSVPTASRDEIGHFSNGGGEFRLDEVDRLRQPQREVMINGQRFSREPTSMKPPRTSGNSGRIESNGSSIGRESSGRPATEFGSSASESFPQSTQRGSETIPRHRQPLSPGNLQQGHEPRQLPNPFSDDPEVGELPKSNQLPESREGQLSEFVHRHGGQPSSSTRSSETQPSFDRSFRRSAQSGSSINSEQPQWGQRTPGGTIGYERDVLIRVTSSQVTIADETSFPIALGLPSDDLRQLLAVHLDHHVQSWGEPPRSFYWLPSVKFIVSPGGNQYYERMKTVMQNWKLRSKVEYVLE